jgi:hypothetical protein
METLRVYRPRMILHGPIGMGQGYVGAAALHHLEGYHVQSLELGTLLSDSTRVGFLYFTIIDLEANTDLRLSKQQLSSYLWKPNGIHHP